MLTMVLSPSVLLVCRQLRIWLVKIMIFVLGSREYLESSSLDLSRWNRKSLNSLGYD